MYLSEEKNNPLWPNSPLQGMLNQYVRVVNFLYIYLILTLHNYKYPCPQISSTHLTWCGFILCKELGVPAW